MIVFAETDGLIIRPFITTGYRGTDEVSQIKMEYSMCIIKLITDVRDFFRDWYLEDMYEKHGEADVPEGASFDDIKKYYDSLEDWDENNYSWITERQYLY